MDLADAHEAHAKAKKDLSKDIDPGEKDQVKKAAHRDSFTVAGLAHEYIERYAKYREKLDYLFAQRASAGTTTWDVRTEIDKATKGLLAELKGQIREIPLSDQMAYMASRRFVESLAYEAKAAAS